MNIIFLLFLLVVLFLIRKPLVRLIKKLEIQSLNDQLDRLTNDPEYQNILKKYNLKPIDWDKEPDEKSYEQHQKNVSKLRKLGLKEGEEILSDEEKKKRNIQRKKKSEQRLKQLIEKYGSEKGELIHKGKVDLGMTTEMVIDSKGKPKEVIEKVSSGKKREEYFYRRYKNRLGKYSYKFRVVLINGKVDGWNDIKN
tara:strand:- start:162 stop:749 length:588 start_codon:yes stop_codon:yes gene_type:complete